MNTAIIVGNGTSRKNIDLEDIAGSSPIYACNAFYRDQGPDYRIPTFLVAIDDGIIQEIMESDFPKDRVIIPPLEERWEPAECNPVRPRSNAGANAMIEAIRRGATELYCFGFDFLLLEESQSVSNLFDGTQNYGSETRANWLDNTGRARYITWIARKCPTVKFTFVYPDEYRNMRTIPIDAQNVFVGYMEKSI